MISQIFDNAKMKSKKKKIPEDANFIIKWYAYNVVVFVNFYKK